MQFFFRNCAHILTRTQGKKVENMFLVKIVSKGTSLNSNKVFERDIDPSDNVANLQ